jgi:serine/threonine-protein kinase HipA
MADCIRLLAGSRESLDVDRFALIQLAFWLLAATDGHAKNYSIFLHTGDTYALTPVYDVLSIFPYVGDGPNQFRWRKAGLALALRARNVHSDLHGIQARHWHGLARGRSAVWRWMLELVERVEPALDAVEQELPSDFPGRTCRTISQGLRHQAERFRTGLDGLPA